MPLPSEVRPLPASLAGGAFAEPRPHDGDTASRNRAAEVETQLVSATKRLREAAREKREAAHLVERLTQRGAALEANCGPQLDGAAHGSEIAGSSARPGLPGPQTTYGASNTS